MILGFGGTSDFYVLEFALDACLECGLPTGFPGNLGFSDCCGVGII